MKNQTNVSMNSTKITCPNCGTEIDVQDIISICRGYKIIQKKI